MMHHLDDASNLARKTSTWGPSMWFSLENVALAYPQVPTQEHKRTMKQFISATLKVLPCARCGAHALDYLRSHPLDDDGALRSRGDLCEWLWDFGKAVDVRLQKKPRDLQRDLRARADGVAKPRGGSGSQDGGGDSAEDVFSLRLALGICAVLLFIALILLVLVACRPL